MSLSWPQIFSAKPRFSASKFINLICLATGLLIASSATASPWVDVGDERTRHHLQQLNDSGQMKTLTTTWPVMWSSIKRGLDSVDVSTLTKQQLWSYQYLQHELNKAQEVVQFKKHTHIADSIDAFSDFASDSRTREELEISVEFTGETSAFRLTGVYSAEPYDDHKYRLDGSYASKIIGNWALSAGRIDQWWGPGWESSAILSNNARPLPGISLQRITAIESDNPIFAWLGPWQFNTFFAQLEEQRHVSRPLVWGARLSFKPIRHLEIGLSRTAMWGGSGRPSDLSTFGNLLIGNDNQGGDNEVEPGNQLAGYDLRWAMPVGSNFSWASYIQLIGEDEAGGLPVALFGLAGFELSSQLANTQFRLSLEAQNTTENFLSEPNYASTYNHGLYKSGYRYYDRAIGSSADNNVESQTLRLQSYFANGQNFSLALSHLRSNKKNLGNQAFGDSKLDAEKIAFNYLWPVSKKAELGLGLFNYNKPIRFEDESIESGAQVNLNVLW